MTTLPPEFFVRQPDRTRLLGQHPCCLWLTGLSGAGKSTIAGRVEQLLLAGGRLAYVLDGDVLRTGLNAGLGFTRDDRAENVRRLGEVARLMVDAGLVVLVSAISPYAADRAAVRRRFGPAEFVEIHVSTSLAVCRQRDTKGLYRQAREGRLRNLSGWGDPYQPPPSPELTIDTAALTVASAANAVLEAYFARAPQRRAPAARG